MPVTVVVGGQFGSEGKGKVSHALASRLGVKVAVRVGGPNSGHTVAFAGRKLVLRHLPTPALLPGVTSVVPPGAYVDVSVLLQEVTMLGLRPNRVVVDPAASVVGTNEKRAEANGNLRADIGSTLSGTGAAVTRRIARDGSATLARDIPELQPYLGPTQPLLRAALNRGQRVLVEGTQGFGLSVLHSPFYPFATSRDTTAAGALAEAGLSPVDVDQVVLVLRAFPIRVGGNSGPLPNELDWVTVKERGGHDHDLTEHTSVTGRVRRVAEFDPDIVRAAIAANAPTMIAMNHLDYVDHQTCVTGSLTQRARAFVAAVEIEIGRQLDLLGLGAVQLVTQSTRYSRLAQIVG